MYIEFLSRQTVLVLLVLLLFQLFYRIHKLRITGCGLSSWGSNWEYFNKKVCVSRVKVISTAKRGPVYPYLWELERPDAELWRFAFRITRYFGELFTSVILAKYLQAHCSVKFCGSEFQPHIKFSNGNSSHSGWKTDLYFPSALCLCVCIYISTNSRYILCVSICQFSCELAGTHCKCKYKVVQIWPGQSVTYLHTNSPGHVWTILYTELIRFMRRFGVICRQIVVKRKEEEELET
jgi:hypothetical protein